jgi:histidinol-phosphate aminotransferase
MIDIQALIRPNVRGLKPYSSARDEFKGNASVWLDANENPVNNGLNRYPDPLQLELKKRIEVLKGVPAANIFLGNGSDEAIDLLFRAFCQPGIDKVIICPPTYGMYQVSAGINDVEALSVPLNHDFQLDMPQLLPLLAQPSVKMVFVCSPNNPTGNSIRTSDVILLAESFHGLVVVDEAYIDFSEQRSFSQEIKHHPNIVVLQTFSKAWGMAGIRLGMAFAHKEVIEVMNRIKPPYNVNVLTQRVALKKLQDTERFKQEVGMVLSEREMLRQELALLPIVTHIFPSDANFLLVRFNESRKVYEHLASKGVVVRDRASVAEGCLRITVGKAPKENRKLLKQLTTFKP